MSGTAGDPGGSGGGLGRFLPRRKPGAGVGRGPGAVLARMSGRTLLIGGVALFAVVLIVVSVVNHRGKKDTASAASASPQATVSGSHQPTAPAAAQGSGGAAHGGAATGLEAIGRKNAGLPVRGRPTNSSPAVTQLQNGEAATLLCYTQGDLSTGILGTTTTWDRVRTSDGRTGYVPDGWVETSAVVSTLVGAC